jgi:hypothetical protein
MQPNIISLIVDSFNTGADFLTKTFTRFEERLNSSKYISESHSLDMRDEASIYRTFPKQAGNFRGVGRSSIKFTEDVVVLGVDGVANLTAPIILEISFSIPKGSAVADVLRKRQEAIAFLDDDDVMDALNHTLMI